MLLHHLLDAVFRVTAGANQVLLRVVDFALVELQLRFGEVQLVTQCFLLVTGRFRFRVGKLRHQRLIGFQKLLRLLQARFDLFGLGTQYGWILGGIAQSRGEGEIDFTIRQAQRFFRERPLFGSRCKLGELLRGLQRRLIDERHS